MEPILKGRAAVVGLLAGVILLSGCAEKRVTVERLPPRLGSSTWSGRSVDEVVATWGKSAERKPDGENGWILTFFSDRGFSRLPPQTVSPPRTGSPARPGGAPPPSLADPPMPGNSGGNSPRPMARFWIGADGIVYRFWFSRESYRKDRHQPPPPDDASELESP